MTLPSSRPDPSWVNSGAAVISGLDLLGLRLPVQNIGNSLFSAAVIALVFINLEHLILPNIITYPGLLIALAALVLFPGVGGGIPIYGGLAATWPAWAASLIDGVAGALIGGGRCSFSVPYGCGGGA